MALSLSPLACVWIRDNLERDQAHACVPNLLSIHLRAYIA